MKTWFHNHLLTDDIDDVTHWPQQWQHMYKCLINKSFPSLVGDNVQVIGPVWLRDQGHEGEAFEGLTVCGL